MNLPDGVVFSECVLICDFFPINGVELAWHPPCSCFSTASVIEDSCKMKFLIVFMLLVEMPYGQI